METKTNNKKVILTGMQPTGKLHLGNFLGAANNWRTMLNDYECLFFIPDMHAITVQHVPAELRKNTLNCVAQYIACGLDPEKCNIFLQSHIIGHTELCWILSCICSIGQLERMTQFKDKSSKCGEIVSAGLLFYPILMAADILLYNADVVPIGEDQKQHLELARDLAQRFNNTFSDTFIVPEPYIGKTGSRIMSLQNPTSKMSKSDKNSNSTIYITDEPDVISKKLASSVTDSGNEIKARDDKPGITNLLSIYSSVKCITIEQAEQEFSGVTSYAPFKKAVAETIIESLTPIRKKYHEIKDDKEYLLTILGKGASVAQHRANKILSKVYRKVGFVPKDAV